MTERMNLKKSFFFILFSFFYLPLVRFNMNIPPQCHWKLKIRIAAVAAAAMVAQQFKNTNNNCSGRLPRSFFTLHCQSLTRDAFTELERERRMNTNECKWTRNELEIERYAWEGRYARIWIRMLRSQKQTIMKQTLWMNQHEKENIDEDKWVRKTSHLTDQEWERS